MYINSTYKTCIVVTYIVVHSSITMFFSECTTDFILVFEQDFSRILEKSICACTYTY